MSLSSSRWILPLVLNINVYDSFITQHIEKNAYDFLKKKKIICDKITASLT